MTKLQIVTCLLIFVSGCKSFSEDKFIGNSSNVVVYVDTTKKELSDCEAHQKQDTLKMTLVGDGYVLSVSKVNDSISSELIQTWSVTDSSYVKPTFSTLYQELLFDKANYKSGNVLKVKVNLRFLATHQWSTEYKDTIKVKGSVSTIVK